MRTQVTIINIICVLLFLAISSCKKKPRSGGGGGGTTIVYGNGEFGQPPQRCPREVSTEEPRDLPTSRRLSNGRVFDPSWSKFIYDKLDEPAFDNLTMGKWTKNTATQTGCKNLEHLNHSDVKKFWIAVFAGLAIYESSYVPTKFYADSEQGAGRDSYGLFQVDPVNCTRWSSKIGLDLAPGGNGIGRGDGPGSPADPDTSRIGGSVYDPQINIECALATMAGSAAQYAASNGKDRLEIFREGRGAYQYWAPLKPKDKKHQKMLADIRYMTAQIPGCKEDGPYGKRNPYGEHTKVQETEKRMCDTVADSGRKDFSRKPAYVGTAQYETNDSVGIGK